jgi:peroxin-5
MALAVSYTNESLQNQALRTLVSWLQRNQKYAALVPANLLEEPQVASSLIGSPSLLEVQHLFLNAAQQNPQNDMDKDIQEALGVLFNLSSEYDKAADCFRAALQVEPQNSKIWNRLGASLANGNRSVEAVDAYQRALELQPGFIRARYNVGIICINLKAYKEAAEHFLMALNHQNSSTSRSGLGAVAPGHQMSDTIWQTMRMLVSLMGRDELQAAVSGRNLDALNRALMTEVD